MKQYIHSCIFFGLLSFSPSCLSKSSPKEVKSALSTIKESLEKNTKLKKNPLESIDIDDFETSGYLHQYKALAYYQISKSEEGKNKLEYLEKALQEINLANNDPYFSSASLNKTGKDILIQAIETSFAIKNYEDLLQNIEKLPKSELKKDHYILYYGFALYKMKEFDEFKTLALKYLPLFENKTAVQNHLQIDPQWDSVLKELPRDSFAPKEKIPLTKKETISKDAILDDPSPYLDKLSPKFNFTEASSIFKIATDLYFKLLEKEDLQKKEKSYLKIYSQKMHNFSGYLIEDLIMQHWKKGDLKSCESLSKTFLNKFTMHPSYFKVLYNLARIQEDRKEYAEAFKSYKKFLTLSNDTTLSELAKFRSAWMWHLKRDVKKSIPLFQEYLNEYPDGRYASTSEYLILKNSISHDKFNKDVFSKFFDKYPLNFYSIMLMDEYNFNKRDLLDFFSKDEISTTFKSKFELFKTDINNLTKLRVYNELIEFGLNEDAIKALKSVTNDEQNEIFTLFLASEFHKLQYANGEQSNLIKLIGRSQEIRDLLPLKGLFPDFKRDLISGVIAELKLDISPFLVMSIIRQESAYDAEARSTANAVGLMQLTDGTAKETAQLLDLNTYTLTNERDNLKLGIRTFAELLIKYNYRIDYALSGYNAGEAITQTWIDARGHLQPIEFIESIPYQETRLYIKNILRNYAIYRLLYDQEPTKLITYSLPDRKN